MSHSKSDGQNLQFGPERNRRRRLRYATDDGYRRKIRKGVSDGVVRPMHKDFDRYIVEIATHGTVRPVLCNNLIKEMLTFNMVELANFLHYTFPVVYRWRKNDLLPEAVALTMRSTKPVYTKSEAIAIANVLKAHQANFSMFYTPAHKETAALMHLTLENIRQQEGLYVEEAKN